MKLYRKKSNVVGARRCLEDTEFTTGAITICARKGDWLVFEGTSPPIVFTDVDFSRFYEDIEIVEVDNHSGEYRDIETGEVL